MLVRPMNVTDADERAAALRVRQRALPLHGVDAEFAAAMTRSPIHWHPSALVAVDDALVGFAAVSELGEGLRAHVLVDPPHRGRGVGRALLAALAEAADGLPVGTSFQVDNEDERSLQFAAYTIAPLPVPDAPPLSFCLDLRRPARPAASMVTVAPPTRDSVRLLVEHSPTYGDADLEAAVAYEVQRASHGSILQVAEVDGRAVGICVTSPMPETRLVYSDYTVVHPEFRRRGIATDLKLAQADWATGIGAVGVVTDVPGPRSPMIGVLTGLGYAGWERSWRTSTRPVG